ncbi:hypothetical protein EVG20_g3299 [Dentipellis fragilis]|uniref:BTB domain-containing protein n=1 Tax=Dentipellis fragilis TaxID=205917 RepID=A0A4Y9Z5D1_9AGAM|nr:hypothetical protein EVG20_g3299 [Dentipellis fragilis]
MASLHGLPFDLRDGLVPAYNRGDPWFDDGSVILLAGSKAFKVYRGLITRDSGYFAKLMSSPLAHNVLSAVVEGCSVVRVDEPPEGVSQALQWIFAGIGTPLPELDDFSGRAPVLKLANKYDIRQLRTALLTPLLHHYSDRLQLYSDWNGLETLPKPINPVHALNFARDTATHSFLPIAALDLSLFVSEAELLAANEPRRSSPYSPGLAHSIDEEAVALLRVHHKNLRKNLAKALSQFDEGRPLSPRRRCCSFKAFYQHIVEVVDGGPWVSRSDGRYGLDMLRVLKTDGARRSYCDQCLNELDGEAIRLYRQWWEDIPGLLGFGGWDDMFVQDV